MQKKLSVILVIFVFIAFIIYFNSSFPPFRFISGVVQSVFLIPKKILYSAKLNLSSQKDIDKLKQENRKLIEKLTDYERVIKDNTALRSQFEIDSGKAQELLPARVIGFLGAASTPTALIIDKGENDGVKKGMAVVVGKNLVGKIETVSKKYSQIILPLNKNFTALGRSSDANTTGIVRGENDFILFDQVVITDSISIDEVITAKGEVDGDGIGLTPDLIIGKITSINKNESKPFQTAKIESLIPFSKLEIVFVAK